ncbi:MAG TPA: DinB family protein [Coriobacteriia bacterium]|nr:DinB family protein [Coriobacteriia bacterium]
MSAAARTPAELLVAYRHGPALLRQTVEDMTPEQLVARPVPGKLSSIEVACHVVDSDQFMCDRMKRVIATDRPLLVGVESIDYPGPLRYQERDLGLDLRLLDVQRQQMAADIEALPAEAWQRIGIHTEIGAVTFYDLFDHAVEHLEDHVERIREKRAALGI